MTAFTEAQLEALNSAIARNVRSIEFSGPQGSRRVTYGSLAEMLQARELMRRELGLTAGRVTTRMSADKGLCQ